MKKSKFGVLSFLSILLLFSFINITYADPSYVGINIDDTYIWAASANMENINTTAINLMGEENWTMAYNMLDEMVFNLTGMEIGNFLGVGIKADITNITEEIQLMPDVKGVAVFSNLSIATEPNVWIEVMNSSYPMTYILDPTNISDSNYFYHLMAGGPPLFTAKGLDYNQIANWMSANITGQAPFYDNITITGLSNGFQVSILGDFLKWSINQSGVPTEFLPDLDDIVCTARWNENGVFSYASVEYAGLALITIQLIAEGEIPGFIISVTLGISSVALIGIIYVIRKRKRIV
jgi:hypothetical protein